ncbi:MAG: hypothetical protein HY331_00575 [Chloroflexi bacterium]|nr:hypothetical protein [Chloroflexota bacterium]
MRVKLVSLVGVGLLAVILLVGPGSLPGRTQAQAPVSSPQPTPFKNRSLVGATPAEVAEYALAGVRANMRIVSGTPQVLLARAVKASELPSLGIPFPSDWEDDNPPLMLVIIHGDIDVTGYFLGMGKPLPPRKGGMYIAFVYDLRAGMPTLTLTSGAGGKFRIALNSPNLPDDPILATPGPTMDPRLLPPTPVTQPLRLPYGSILPPPPTPRPGQHPN